MNNVSNEVVVSYSNSHESNSGLKKAMHGYMFQLKILMLFFIRGLENGYSFNLMTEWDPAGKFDDLGFVYDNKNRIGKIYRLLQAKHSWSDNKEISENDLFMEKNDFSIQKYFISYRETIKNEQFTKPNIEIKDFIIFTNRNPEQILRDQLQEITDEDMILDNKKYHKNSKRYKIGTGKLKDKIVPILKNLSDLHKLLRILAAGKTLDFKNDRLLQSYRNVLEREVLHIDNNVHRPDPHTVKFSRCFLDGSSEELIKIKNIFYQDWKPNEKFNEQQLEEWEAQTFNFLKKDFKKIQYDFIKEFAAEIGKAKNKAGNIVNITINKDISQSCIDKIKEMMIKNENEENLFSFRSEFFKQKKLSNEILNKFRNELTEELRRLKMEFTEIEYYQFHIIDFLKNEKSNLPEDDVTDEEINDFLSKLIFAVNQPNEGELDKIIESEIADNDDMTSISEFSTNNFQKYMHDWLKAKESNFLNDNDAKFVFKEIRSKMAKIMLSSNSLHCIKLLENMNITFTDDAANELNLKSFLESTVKDQIVLNIISDEIELSSAKVYQILKNFYTNKNDYNFLNFSSIDFLRKYVIQTFDSQNNNCLVILCNKEDATNNIVLTEFLDEIKTIIIHYNETVDEANKNKVEENIIKYPNKKIILIANVQNSENSGYKIHKDVNLDFVDLSSESQKKIMKRNVKFQGKKIRLGSLILNEKLTHSLKSGILSNLIKNEEIIIGKELTDLGEIKDYYIHRSFERKLEINENFKSLKDIFFTIEIVRECSTLEDLICCSSLENNYKTVIFSEYTGKNIHWLKKKQNQCIWWQSNGTLLEKYNSEQIFAVLNAKLKNNMDKFLIINLIETKIQDTILLFSDHTDDRNFNILCNETNNNLIYWFKKEENDLILWKSRNVLPTLIDIDELKKYINENLEKEPFSFLIIKVTQPNIKQDVVLITCETNNNSNPFKNLCEKFIDKNVHWLKKKGNNYRWYESRGSLEKLRLFVSKGIEAFENIKEITDISEKIVIIVAEPGMGKSTVLTHLAIKTKDSDPQFWIVRINLIYYSNKLKNYDIKHLERNPMEFIYYCALNEETKSLTDLQTELFNHFYRENKVILLFDGFDEINPYYKDKVTVLLKTLKSNERGIIWITTRPYGIQDELENDLSVFSHSIKSISEENQIEFLEHYWKRALKPKVRDYSTVFINELLKKFSQSTNDQGGNFVEIPLHIRMVADVFQEIFNEFYELESDFLSNEIKQKIHEKLNLINLYECFIQIKFDKIFIKNTYMDISISSVKTMIEKDRKDLLEKHKKLAFVAIFGEDVQNIFKDITHQEIGVLYDKFGANGIKILDLKEVDFINDILICNEKIGIIDRIIDNRPIFVHKSFAEYFVALWFADNWEKQERVQIFLYEHIFKEENIVIRKIFDRLMIKNDIENRAGDENLKNKKYEIHEAVLNNNRGKVLDIIKKDKEQLNTVDKGGRTALHLAAAYGYEEIVQDLLEISEVNSNDKIFGLTPFMYAAKLSCWIIIELYLKKANYDKNHTRALHELLRNMEIKISNKHSSLDDAKNYYVERVLIQENIFNKQTLEKQTRLFYFLNKVEDAVSIHNEIKADLEKDIILITDDTNDNNFNILRTKYWKKNIHWLKNEKDYLIWQRSHGSLVNLRGFIDTNMQQVPKPTTAITDKIVIIVDKPGIGKSTLLTHFQNDIKKSDPLLWIVRPNVIELSIELRKWDIEQFSIEYAKQCICRFMNLQTFLNKNLVRGFAELNLLEQEIFNFYYKNNKIILLWFDWFDDICTRGIKLLKILKDSDLKQVWVITRNYEIKNDLENELSIFTYSLQPISKENQITFLKKYWKRHLNEDINSDNLINDLLKFFSESINDKAITFIQIPLHLEILAEYLENRFERWYSSKNRDILQTFVNEINLVDFYESFVYKKFYKIIFIEHQLNINFPHGQRLSNSMYEKFLINSKILAFHALFGADILNMNLDVDYLLTAIKSCREKSGFIDRIVDNKPIFVHKSFAEYFVALWLAENWEKQEKAKKFLRENILKSENLVIRNFFDLMMVKNNDCCGWKYISNNKYAIHLAILKQDKSKICELLSNKKESVYIINSVDTAGRTPIHLAVGYGYIDIVEVLLTRNNLKLIKNIDLKDKIFDQSPLICAEGLNNWKVAELLLTSGANSNEMSFNGVLNVQNLLKLFVDRKYEKLTEILRTKLVQ